VTDKPWRLIVAGPAKRTLDRLPVKIAVAVLDFILGPLCEKPHRVGKPLRGDLTGLHSARVGGYQVVYEINDTPRTVIAVHIDHSADVYRRQQADRAVVGGYRRFPPTQSEREAAVASLRDAIAEEPW
jgi:mRNA interferase RelE/StbE